MKEVIMAGSGSAVMEASPVSSAAVPLSFLRPGEAARIVKIRDKGEIHHHLESLGFVEGAQIKVICENGGNLITEVKGAQIALNRQLAAKIITK